MLLGELYKQYDYYRHGDWGVEIVNKYQWYVFPLQFCGTPLYVLPATLFISNKKIRKVLYTYLATFGLFAGIIVMALPSGVFRDRAGIDNQTMIHHVLMIWGGLAIWKNNLVGIKKDYFKSAGVFFWFLIVALFLNVVLAEISGGTINLFYINPVLETTLPVFPIIQRINYLLFLALYALLFSAMGFFVYFIGSKRFLIKEKVDDYFSKRHREGKVLLFFVLLFLAGNTIYIRLFFSQGHFINIDFFNLSLPLILNGIIGDLIFYSLLISIVFLIFRKSKARIVALGAIQIGLGLFVFFQMSFADGYNSLMEVNQFNMLKNPATDLSKQYAKHVFNTLIEQGRFKLAIFPTIFWLSIVVMLRRVKFFPKRRVPKYHLLRYSLTFFC